MAENSGGSKDTDKKMIKFGEEFPRKNRSNSMGSTTFSKSEINKIIHGYEEKTAAELIRTQSTKQTFQYKDNIGIASNIEDNTNSRQIPEILNKLKDNSTVTDYVFKSPDNSGKRTRNVMSPEEENCYKRTCDGIRLMSDAEAPILKRTSVQQTIQTSEKQKELQIGSILNDTFEALGKIEFYTSEEVNGSPAIIRYNQERLRKSTTVIYKNLTLITLKMGQLEQEKMSIAHELELATLKIKNDSNTHPLLKASNQESIVPKEKTYAAVVQEINPSKTNNDQEKQTWTTPKVSKKLETLVKINDVSDPREAMCQLKKEIERSGIEGGFKNIKHLKDGAIVFESRNEAQQKILKNTLEKKDNIKIKESGIINPMFMITGILKGYSETEFIEELIRMNDTIETDLNISNLKMEIKVIAKKQCRNLTKENWILQAQPAIAKWFLKAETVNFDMMKVYVQEHVNLALCFKCCGFGHVGKYCKERLCCHKCGEYEHSGSDCQSIRLKCINCIKMKYKAEESQHSARDINCPVYQRRLKNYRSQINYSDNFL